MELLVFDRTADVVILIVGFRNAADIKECLGALSRATAEPNFDVFICENGGMSAFERLVLDLVDAKGSCLSEAGARITIDDKPSRFIDIRHLNFRARSSNVWIGCATENLGYAGGINAWLHHLLRIPGWKGIWVLNPDTVPDDCALAALVERAEKGERGMVGSTLLDGDKPGHVRLRGGLHWQRALARGIAIGLGERLDAQSNIPAIEAAMDSPSGASMYVTRPCIEKIGLMDESYFLFFEDLDWGVRGKAAGLGYASDSIVAHKRGTTTGSAKAPVAIPRLSVYLQHRNGIHFVRRHFPWLLPLRVLTSFLYALRFLLQRAPRNSLTAIQGVFAGLRGEKGRPEWHRKSS
jgi:GT2 family glycosyltransferase